MNEVTKTGIFGAGALLALVLAVVASSSSRKVVDGDDSLGVLFPDFTDATVATAMEIVKFDEDTSERHTFKVGKRDNVWVIPSKSDYPADASKKLAEAATALIGVPHGPTVSDQRGSHGTFGVIEPSGSLEAGTKGVGQLVTLEAENGKKLAELIVGKEVKDRFGWHYVRIPRQDYVYQVKIDADKFSTKFEDWIERDVLRMKLKERDDKQPEQRLTLSRVIVKDYEAQMMFAPGVGPRPRIVGKPDQLDLRYDDSATDKKWTIVDMEPDKELVESKLNDLRFALDDVKIVDVYRKPQALRDVLAGKSKGGVSQDEIMGLIARGFFPDEDMLSSSGEVVVQTREGITYFLQFGNIADKTFEQKEVERQKAEQQAAAGKKTDDKAAQPNAGAEKKALEKQGTEKKDGSDSEKLPAKEQGEKTDGPTGSNRYLFVQVAFNKELVPKPKIKHVFGESHLAKAAVEQKSDKEKAGKEKESEKSEKKKTEKKGGAREPKLADPVKELMRLNEERLVDKAEYETRRKEIEEQNKTAQKEYDEKIKAAEQRVKELNERFADWYYVIDDDTFKKIRVKRADIVKAPEKKEDSSGKKTDDDDDDMDTPKAP